MATDVVRKRFSMLLKEMHRKYGNEMSSTDYYNSLDHLRQESVSKIANNKQAIRDAMLLELINIDPDISLDWIFTGNGAMFKSDIPKNSITEDMATYSMRVKMLEAKVDKMEALLEETLKLTRLDLVNRGLLKDGRVQ